MIQDDFHLELKRNTDEAAVPKRQLCTYRSSI